MSRTSGSYDSLIKGVSQQAAHDRLPGQHWEQDNMISDPVRGLSRRHGSLYMDSVALGGEMSVPVQQDVASRLEDTIFLHGVEYALFRRDGSVPASTIAPIHMVNKDTKKFVPVVFSNAARDIARRGISSVCVAGQFVLMAAAQDAVTHTVVDNLKASANRHVIWLRGGGYSRTFTITATATDGTQQEFKYTTMKSYYDTPLDTTDIPWNKPGTEDPDPSYNKKVNDRTNAYNSAVNKHIADAAKDITPENLAIKLGQQLTPVFPNTLAIGPYIVINATGYVFSAEDGGNGEFIRAASRDVTSPEMLTPQHYVGKVMIVQPKAAGSVPYYMQAESATGASGFTEVTWREVAGEVVTPTFLFLLGVMFNGSLYVASTPHELGILTGETYPRFEPSVCGDTINRPVPELFGRRITYMQMVQDRLMMIAGATVFMSRTGDYFNLFGASMLTVKNDDPIEVFAQGTEDDTITAGVQLDRNVVLFGKRFQYVVPGREALTPNNAYVGVIATYEAANIVPPTSGGALLFFCQRRERRLTMQQMQPGSVVDRLEAFDVSAQLDGYLTGTPRQLVAMTSPSCVFVRTQELTNGFYCYSFLDSNDQTQRLFDSWSRWTFDQSLGTLMGITGDDSGVLAVTARRTPTGNQLVLDRFSRETALSDKPYLDSMQPAVVTSTLGEAFTVFDARSQRHLTGVPFSQGAALAAKYPADAQYLWTGTQYPAYTTLTSPYLRDQKDRVILDAKLTVTKLVVSSEDSSAMVAEISTDGGKSYKVSKQWRARPVGGWVLGTQRVEEQHTETVPVMKDNKTYRMRLRADGWLPLTLSVVEWSGQAFTSRR